MDKLSYVHYIHVNLIHFVQRAELKLTSAVYDDMYMLKTVHLKHKNIVLLTLH